MNNLTKMLSRNLFFSNVFENVVRKFLNDNFTSDSPQSAAHKENCLYLNYHISLLFPSQHNTELRNLPTHFAVTLILSWCLSHLKLRVGLGSRIISLRVDDCKLLIRFHVQAVVPVMLVKPTDTLPLASMNISPLTNIPKFLHLRGSENCCSLCSKVCFKILDSASTSFQLKIKEAMHILWEQPSLNSQVLSSYIHLLCGR